MIRAFYILDTDNVPLEEVTDIIMTFVYNSTGRSFTKHCPEVVIEPDLAYVFLTYEEASEFEEGGGLLKLQFMRRDVMIRDDLIEIDISDFHFEAWLDD